MFGDIRSTELLLVTWHVSIGGKLDYRFAIVKSHVLLKVTTTCVPVILVILINLIRVRNEVVKNGTQSNGMEELLSLRRVILVNQLSSQFVRLR